MKTAVVIFAAFNIAMAAFLWYLWETPGSMVTLDEAFYGTNTIRFLLFVSGIVGVIYVYNKRDKE